MNLVSNRSPQAQVAIMETAEDKFSVALAHWGLELMSVPANVACHQNPIELLVLTVSCSGNFFPWLHTGLLETGLGVDGQRNPRENCSLRPDDKYSLCMFRFFGEEHVFYLLCLSATIRIKLGNQTQLDGLFSQSKAGNRAGPLPAAFTENVDMKASVV